MIKMLKILLIILPFSASAAGMIETGAVESGWLINGDGNVFFYLAGTNPSTACPAIPERRAFDATTPVGKSR